MKKTSLIIILLFGIVIYSCDKKIIPDPEPIPEPEPEYSIVGEWEWISSYDGWDGGYSTDTMDLSISINFKPNDSLILTDNQNTIFEASYLIRTEDSTMFGNNVDVLYINSDSSYIPESGILYIVPNTYDHFFIRKLTDTLWIAEDCYDCGGHALIRVNN